MKLVEIYIDGFGVFHDYQLKELSPGLNIFIGLNEAGKSTLLAFKKRLLFGFPDRRSRLNPYTPLAGGNHGGRLVFLSDAKLKYTLERYVEKKNKEVHLILPDGSLGGERELKQLLGQVSKDVFENIYAFGLSELQDFETLNSEGIKGRIYSAGVGMGVNSPLEVKKELAGEIEQLFKPRGSIPEINRLFSLIREKDAELTEINRASWDFDVYQRELAEKTAAVETITQELKEITNALKYTENLLKLREDWLEIEEARKQLQEIPQITSFPAKGLEILQRYSEKEEELKAAITDNKVAREKNKNRQAAIEINEKLLARGDKILALQKGQNEYLNNIKELQQLEEKLIKEKEDLEVLLQEIGPEWTEEKLLAFDVSIPAREEVREKYQALLEKVKDEIQRSENELQRIIRGINELDKELDDLEIQERELAQQCETGEKAKKIKEQKEKLQDLRTNCWELTKKEMMLKSLEKQEGLLTVIEAFRPKPVVGAPRWAIFCFFSVVIISFLLAVLENNLETSAAIFFILLVGIILYVILGRKKQITFIKSVEDKALKNLVDQPVEILKQKETLHLELQKLKDKIRLAARDLLFFEDVPDFAALEKKEQELQAKEAVFLKWEELVKQCRVKEKRKESLVREKELAENNLVTLRKELVKATKDWQNWLVSRGLPIGLSPDGVNDVFAVVRSGREKQKVIQEIREKNSILTKAIEKYKTEVMTLLAACDKETTRKEIAGMEVVVELEKLAAKFKQAEENKRILDELKLKEEDLQIDWRNMEKELQEQRKEIAALLLRGAAASREEFEKNARNYHYRNELLLKISQREQAIKKISGSGKLYEKFVADLKEKSLQELEEREKQLNEYWEEKNKSLSELNEERGRLVEKIAQLEQESRASALRLERAVAIENLQKKAEEWSVLVLAKTIIEKSIEKYEQERQPGVIKEAQFFFSRMTLGRYSRIFAPLGETKVYVEDRDGRCKGIEDLSRGTAEQLYLALRFGFIREFSQRSESLPVVFDDIFVNFDPERFQAAGEAVKELVKTNQVFYFTCHPESAAVLSKIIPEAKVIDI